MGELLPGYWYSRFIFERALACIYLVAFLVAANQFVALLGSSGLQPAARFAAAVPFRFSPSLFYFLQSDTAFRVAAWIGVALSLLMLTGYPQRAGTWPSAAVWLVLWVLYLSFVNVGQTFYGFGWETLLLEAGFFAMFLGGAATAPTLAVNVIWRWLLFRVMFGAGLIKIRGDQCWRNLTCLNYYFETQPIPNGLSWYFHWLPDRVHRGGVVINHIVELGVPFLYFLPQPVAGIAAIVTILFQATLIVSGNLSWLNWLTIVIAIPILDDRWWFWLRGKPALLAAPDPVHRFGTWVAAALVAVLSIQPVRNMLSRAQMMNASFEPLHLVNTYGAFGSITRVRQEIVFEGTDADVVDARTVWREYAFKGKPGDPMKRPPQIAPYHLRLDWLMWFAAFSPVPSEDWHLTFVTRLLQGDPATLDLLAANPFPNGPPKMVRARYYEYHFTTPDERRRTAAWWRRELTSEYLPPVHLEGGELRVVR